MTEVFQQIMQARNHAREQAQSQLRGALNLRTNVALSWGVVEHSIVLSPTISNQICCQIPDAIFPTPQLFEIAL